MVKMGPVDGVFFAVPQPCRKESVMAHQIDVVTPSMKGIPIFERNMACLRDVNPALARRIEELPGDGIDPEFPGVKFEIRAAKNGMPVMFAVGDDFEIGIHSAYDPVREASDKVNGALGEKGNNYFVLLGFGLGYVVDQLRKDAPRDCRIIVIEAHWAAFRLALETRDLREILSDKRIFFAFGNRIEDGLGTFISKYVLADCTGIGFIELNGRNVLPSTEFYRNFLERLKGVIVTSGGNLQTLMTMAWTYQKNTMMSLRMILEHAPVRTLFGAFERKPAVIVSAGPSLDKNVHLLKEIKDRAVIIGVDTSLRRLLSEGIEPDLLCTGDPQEANWKHMKGTVTERTRLVAEPMTYFASLEHFDSRLFIASFGDKVMKWMCDYIPDVGYVMCWGSVATMAFDLARKLGCDPIIFIGQDLSFPGGRTYSRGTYFEVEEGQDMSVESYQKRFRTYNVTDIFGNDVKTNRQMFAYKEWFRTEIGSTKVRVINATEGGILKDNVEIMTLREAIDTSIGDPFDKLSVIEACSENFDGYDVEPLRKGLLEIINSIKDIIGICDEGTKIIREAVNAVDTMQTLPQTWCAKTIADLDRLRFKLREEPAMSPFIETANQTGVLNFHRGYRKLNNQKFSRRIFTEAMDLFTDLFMSMGRTSRGVLPFFVKGFKSIPGEPVKKRKEETCTIKN